MSILSTDLGLPPVINTVNDNTNKLLIIQIFLSYRLMSSTHLERTQNIGRTSEVCVIFSISISNKFGYKIGC